MEEEEEFIHNRIWRMLRAQGACPFFIDPIGASVRAGGLPRFVVPCPRTTDIPYPSP